MKKAMRKNKFQEKVNFHFNKIFRRVESSIGSYGLFLEFLKWIAAEKKFFEIRDFGQSALRGEIFFNGIQIFAKYLCHYLVQSNKVIKMY